MSPGMRSASNRRRRPTTRRPWPVIGFSVVVIVAVGLLGAAVLSGPIEDARHAVVTVEGTVVDRTALRARLVLDADLLGARHAVLRTALSRGFVTPEQRDQLAVDLDAAAADPLRTAIDGLVRDVLIRQTASAGGLNLTTDVAAELQLAAIADFAIRVQVLTIAQPYADATAPSGDWPKPASNARPPAEIATARATAATRAARAFAAGTPVPDIVAGLLAAGWRASGGERWLPATGPVAGLPDGWVSAVRATADGSSAIVGPVDDPITGSSAIGRRFADRLSGEAATSSIDPSRIDGAALRDWAEARAAERALRDRFSRRWASEPQARVRVAELVIGSAAVEGVPGPYRSFAHLVVHQLTTPIRHDGESDEALATRLVGELRALTPDDRAAQFVGLMDTANGTPSTDPLAASGEIGFFTRDQLVPALADAAFAETVVPGDVLGPIGTVAGPELFLLRARFTGPLDERSNAALVEARTTTDLAALARRISPAGEAGRAAGTLWRTAAETIAEPAIERAYAETPIGDRSEPVVLDGEIVVVAPLERMTGPLGLAELDRLRVRGFEAWLAGRFAAAIIVRDREPLPGIDVASPSASASATASAGLPTPVLPSLPGPGAPSAPASAFPIATPPLVP